MKILAIETSCDETAVAIVDGATAPDILANAISSQIPLHQKTNGVVPEVAARAQLEAMLPVLDEALTMAGISHDEAAKQIEAIAVTKGPGLIGSLLVGVETAKTLALAWQKPVYGIHHIEGHIYSAFAGLEPKQIQFPLLALVVSGGHSQLVLIKTHFQYEIIGSTRDDAAGEAFDKIARLLDLGYPGGPAISQLAATYTGPKDPFLPRPLLNDPSLDFSFSGLKTAVLYKVKGEQLDRQSELSEAERQYLAYDAEMAIVEVLIAKTKRAIEQYQPRAISLVGGVSANLVLRERFSQLSDLVPQVLVVPREYSTDNAVMIGIAAWYRLTKQQLPDKEFSATPRLPLSTASS